MRAGTAPERQFSGDYPIQVVCTTGPVADLLRNLGGENLQVAGLMGPGVDPHLYTAVPADIEKLAAADMIFYNGMHLEGRMADLFEDLSDRKPTYAVTHLLVEANDARLRKPPEFEGYYDPHVWHDPKLWAECVKYVADVLSKFDPKIAKSTPRIATPILRSLQKRITIAASNWPQFHPSSACSYLPTTPSITFAKRTDCSLSRSRA